MWFVMLMMVKTPEARSHGVTHVISIITATAGVSAPWSSGPDPSGAILAQVAGCAILLDLVPFGLGAIAGQCGRISWRLALCERGSCSYPGSSRHEQAR